MGDFVNGIGNKVVAILLSIVVIAINLFFVTNVVGEMELSAGYIAIVGNANSLLTFDILITLICFAVIFAVLYLGFVVYLVIHMFCSMGANGLAEVSFVKKYVLKRPDSDRLYIPNRDFDSR